MGPTPIPEVVRAYGLHPRLWLLVLLKGNCPEMGWKHYQTVDHPKWEPQVGRRLFGIRLLILHFKFQISNISYFTQFNLFFEKKNLFPKMSKNHPKIYAKPPNGGYGNKQRELVLLKTWPRYWHKGRVKRRQNSPHVYPRLNIANTLLNLFSISCRRICHDLLLRNM